MAAVQIVDRSSLIQRLYRELVLDPRQTAIVTVDMHRGHPDMDVDGMYGDDLHILGLQNVARCLGRVITNAQLFEQIRAATPAAAAGRKAPADAVAK